MRPQRIEPGPGQESVWDYPRPPRVEATSRRVRVVHAGRVVADSVRCLRVLETSQAPAFYVPSVDVRGELLRPSRRRSVCEWKGQARYWHVAVGNEAARDAAWTYERPLAGYEAIAGHVAFYPARVDACWVGRERARPMEGGFYGGWVTDDVVGPFKGARGTEGW